MNSDWKILERGILKDLQFLRFDIVKQCEPKEARKRMWWIRQVEKSFKNWVTVKQVNCLESEHIGNTSKAKTSNKVGGKQLFCLFVSPSMP